MKTPFDYWFRVHHVGPVDFCRVRTVRNVCEFLPAGPRPLTRARTPILHYALSPDGTVLAYVRRDASQLPHVFVIQVDGTNQQQITRGAYADGAVMWPPNDSTSIDYYRRPVSIRSGRAVEGRRQIWNINVDGSHNARLGS